jgi:hypothetical protein
MISAGQSVRLHQSLLQAPTVAFAQRLSNADASQGGSSFSGCLSNQGKISPPASLKWSVGVPMNHLDAMKGWRVRLATPVILLLAVAACTTEGHVGFRVAGSTAAFGIGVARRVDGAGLE